MRDLYIKDYELLSRKSLKKALQHTMQEVCVLQTKEGKQVLARGGDVSEERTSQSAQDRPPVNAPISPISSTAPITP